MLTRPQILQRPILLLLLLLLLLLQLRISLAHLPLQYILPRPAHILKSFPSMGHH